MTNLPNPNPDFRIAGIGHYLTRDGKAFVDNYVPGDEYPWKGNMDGVSASWTDCGLFRIGRTSNNDIIAKAPTAAGEGLPSPIVPGFWKIANGEKVYVLGICPAELNYSAPVSGRDADDISMRWRLDGTHEIDPSYNLIAPWREPVVVEGWMRCYPGGHFGSIFYDKNSQERMSEIAINGDGLDIHLRITDNVPEIIPENGDE